MVKAYVHTRSQSIDEIVMEDSYRRNGSELWEKGVEWVVIKGRDESVVYPSHEILKIQFIDED